MLTIALLTLLLGSPQSAPVKLAANPKPNTQYHIVREKIGTFKVIHEGTAEGEGLAWAVTPLPPSIGSQEVTSAVLFMDGKPSIEVLEASGPGELPFRRPLLKVETPVHGAVKLRLEVTGTWYSTQVKPGPGTEPAPKLSNVERKMWLRSSEDINHLDPRFRTWLKSHIQRKPNESDYTLAKRVAVFFGGFFQYGDGGGLDSLADAAIKCPKGVCTNLSMYLVGCYRALGLPAMIYSGMLFGGGNHTLVLVWTEAGWTPCDPTDLCNSHGTNEGAFGYSDGKILIMGMDGDYLFPVAYGTGAILCPNASRILVTAKSGELADFATDDAPTVTRLSN